MPANRLLLAVTAACLLSGSSRAEEPPAITFHATDASGVELTEADYRGVPLVIATGAAW
jgi:hypothetical protein